MGDAPRDPGPASVGSSVLQAQELPTEEETRRRDLLAESRGIDVVSSAELEKIEGSNGLLHFLPDGTLWTQVPRHRVDDVGRRNVRVVFEGPRGKETPRYIAPADKEVPGAPATIDQWNEREARKAAAAEQQGREAEARLKRLQATARPVTVADFERDLPSTLRGMVDRLLLLGGRVEVAKGRIVVALPPAETGLGTLGPRIARLLYSAEGELLATRKGDGRIAAEKVPDRGLLPSGRLEP
jgi:hypothetical protein